VGFDQQRQIIRASQQEINSAAGLQTERKPDQQAEE